MQSKFGRGRTLHRLYFVGIWFKGLNGIVETICGALLLAVSKAALHRWVVNLTQQELAEDPTDWLANQLRLITGHLSVNTKLFDACFLLGHGLLKIGLVWGGLWRGKLWAFPAALIVLGGFMAWQTWRLWSHFSYTLLGLTLIDTAVFLLIAREYRVRLQIHPRQSAASGLLGRRGPRPIKS